MNKQARSLKPGTMLVAYNEARKDDRAYAIVLKNDYASKYCILYAINYRGQEIHKEWTKEYSYNDMKGIIKSCQSIH